MSRTKHKLFYPVHLMYRFSAISALSTEHAGNYEREKRREFMKSNTFSPYVSDSSICTSAPFLNILPSLTPHRLAWTNKPTNISILPLICT